MPVNHIAFLKFKPDTTDVAIKDVYVLLADLLNLIPGILEFSGGIYSSPEGLNKGYTHAFQMKFVDEVSRDNYFPHPEHERVKSVLVPMLEDVVVFDYVS
jgi:hypothetical protein